jgi:polysaccharide export outer membrane protein
VRTFRIAVTAGLRWDFHVRLKPLFSSILPVVFALGVAGCSFTPSSGPTGADIKARAEILTETSGPAAKLRYAMLTLTPGIVSKALEEDVNPAFSVVTTAPPEAQIVVGIGDVIAVTIFESEPGGLFIPADAGSRPGNFIQLPLQQVDQSGTISVPFGGRIKAAGETPAQIQGAIQRRLANRALEPQAIVTVSDRRSHSVSILGDVAQPLQFSIDPGGVQLMSAIARAGGAKFPGYESTVMLQRDGRTERAVLSDLIQTAGANIQMQPGDVVYVAHEPRYFIAFGATGQGSTLGPVNRRFSFDDSKLTLADALGKAGGLQDDRADPTAVFLYRSETKASLQAMGLAVPEGMPDRVPTIYLADLRDPTGYFLTTKFPMRNEDVIFVSNAPSTDINKFIGVILPLTQTVYYGRLGVQ